MTIAINEDKESTRTSKINNNINIAQIEFEDQFEHLYRLNDSTAQEVMSIMKVRNLK